MPPNHYKAMPVLIITVIFACAAPCAAAQPDAGRLLQEQRQQVPQVPQRPPQVIDKDGGRAPLGDTGAQVLVQGFVFSGIEGLATEAELSKLVEDAIGRELGFAELQALAERVTRYLRDDKGYLLARAYLPKQDITGGIIEIAVIAGRIEGGARIDVKPPSRIRPGLLEGIAGRSVADGQAARLKDIERAVLLMNDLPGITAHASLERGETPGASRLVITAREGLAAGSVLAFDNYGDRYTGVRRGIVQLAANDPCGLGDQLSVGLTLTRNLYQARGAYSLPLGGSGATWSLYASHLDYELGSDMEDLDVDGSARTLGTSLGYPLLRTRAASLWVNAGYEHLAMEDDTLGAETRKRRLPVGNASLTGSFFDGLGGGGISSLSVALYRGDLDISPADDDTADALGPRTQGGFLRATYSLARLQRLTSSVSLLASVRGQVAGGNLDSSQKFLLGGPGGVRSYPVGEAAGDQGHLMTGEVRCDLPFGPKGALTQLVGFVDAGAVTLSKRTWEGALTNATENNRYWLSGGGAGVNVGNPGRYSLRLAYAHKIGRNAGRNMDDTDTDNHRDHGRLWFQAMAWF